MYGLMVELNCWYLMLLCMWVGVCCGSIDCLAAAVFIASTS